MRKIILGIALLCAAASGISTAQNHDTGYVITCSSGSHRIIARMSPAGSVSGQTTLWSNWGSTHDPIMALDNDGYHAIWNWSSKNNSAAHLAFLDRDFKIQTETVMARTSMYEMEYSPDGVLYVNTFTEVWRYWPTVSRFTTLTTLYFGGLTPDMYTGQFIGNCGDNMLRLGIAGKSAGVVTTLARLPFRVAGFSFVQHHATGDYFSLVTPGHNPPVLCRITPAGAVTTLSSLPLQGPLLADRGSSASPRLIGTLNGRLMAIDPRSGAVSSMLTTVPSGWHLRTIDRGRNLATELETPGKWRVRLSFPGKTHAQYVLAVSVTGTQPGVSLADGRKIALVPDAITIAGLQGLLPPALQGTRGVLDSNGTATAIVDVRRFLGTKPTGVRLWLIGLLLDEKSPSGIGIIADPVVISM